MSAQIPEPVASFLAAVTAHDRSAFADHFTDTPVVDDWGLTLAGLDQITTWSDEQFIGSSPSLDVTEVSAEGTTVTVVGDWRSQHANGPSRFDFEIEGDRIASMTIREG